MTSGFDVMAVGVFFILEVWHIRAYASREQPPPKNGRLKLCFDKPCGQSVTRRLVTPKRSFSLPEILDHQEVHDFLAAATIPRDQLLLGLLYGCGLRPGELFRFTWADIDPDVQISYIPRCAHPV